MPMASICNCRSPASNGTSSVGENTMPPSPTEKVVGAAPSLVVRRALHQAGRRRAPLMLHRVRQLVAQKLLPAPAFGP